MRFFEGCNTLDEVRAIYRRLAMQYHPDRGGDTRTMQDINAEYALICKLLVRRQNPTWTSAKWTRMDDVNEVLRKVILELLKLDDIVIELCGYWIWVGGDTKKHREKLSGLGLRWASKKKRWYFAGIPAGGHKPVPMDIIRAHYGSRVIVSDDEI